MKRALFIAAILTPAAAASANEEPCWPVGSLFGSAAPAAFGLVMNRPTVSKQILLENPAAAKPKLLIAREEYAIQPQTRYLDGDIDINYKPTEKMSKFVPLSKGAPISIWRYGVSEERQCTIGWQKGLFGGATGDGHYRWLCLEDTDKDGKYDTAWRPKGNKDRVEIKISPAVGWTTTPPADFEIPKGGPLSSYPASRSIEVSSVSKTKIRIEYRGVGVARGKENRIDLDAIKPGSATLGGITITLTPGTGKAPPTLAATGSFTPHQITEQCNETNYKIGSFSSRVMFSFPSW